MAIVTDGLVAHYRASKAKNGTAPGNNTDPTGTWDDLLESHDGSLSTFAYTSSSGWVGDGSAGSLYALQFDGSNDIVNCGGAGDWNTPSALTLEGWVYIPASNGSSYPRIVDKCDGSSNGFSLYIQGSSANIGTKTKVGSTVYDQTFTATALSVGWHHVVMTYDDADDYLRAYVDGSAYGNAIKTGGGTITTSSVALCIGNRASDSARPWYGAIAAVRVYNRALSSSEVSQNYNEGVNGGAPIPAAGTAAASSSASASIAANRVAGGTASGTSGVACTVTGKRFASGPVDVASGSSAAVTATLAASGAVAAVSGVTGGARVFGPSIDVAVTICAAGWQATVRPPALQAMVHENGWSATTRRTP
jgi:hypothetical protein